MNAAKEWWGADVVPRIKWVLRVSDYRRIKEGDEIPNGYGIAYYEIGMPVAVCMPIPINLIVGAWRALRWKIVCPPWRHTEWKNSLELARRQGYLNGKRDGYFEAADAARRERAMLERENDSR